MPNAPFLEPFEIELLKAQESANASVKPAKAEKLEAPKEEPKAKKDVKTEKPKAKAKT